ncbi:cytochrome P450 [Actinomadura sp. WAC 06369]|uniref:cytochrome P450 n=1 Tax=Actinomadura sp. WAC 06369 TaxID=2203193 RepID=UPI000F776A4B|nr:cytochrome P450 [Actinomadura sp. WAC 06369]RSN52050.1 cytochrome P450 [Actinomadura sp. WAC 06369]
MGVRFSLYEHGSRHDPYPVYARLREEAPVFRNDEEDFWALSRHADVVAAFRDHERFSNANGILLEPSVWGPDAHRHASFLAMDPPDHTRMRGLVSRAFTPRRVAELEPRIREIARGHLDRALQHDSFDLAADYAALLPMDVISELAGVPEADRSRLRHLADQIVRHEDGVRDLSPAGVDAIFALGGYFGDLVAERRRDRRDDLASALVEAADGDDRLTDAEILGVLFILVAAGNETTTNLISNAWHCARAHLDRPADAFGRVGDWIEETLRFEPASQGDARTVVRDVELHGTTMPAGSRLLLLIGAANRDPRAFADPDRFDLDRDTRTKISFGSGRHHCIGAHLARLEARVALEELTARITDYDVDEDAAARIPSPYVRGFRTLPTTVVTR